MALSGDLPAAPKRARVERESPEQIALFQWASLVKLPIAEVIDGALQSLTVADLLIWIPNGAGKLPLGTAGRMKAMGLTPGVSDLQLCFPCGGFHGLWIEMKAARPYSAAVSADQKLWLDRMARQGYAAAVARGWNEAAGMITRYLAARWEASDV